MRAGAHARQRRHGDLHTRRRRGRLQPRLRLPQGRGAQAAARGPRPGAHATHQGRRCLPRCHLGRGVALIDQRLSPILAADRNAAAIYLGNPNAHNLDALLYGRVLIKALATRNAYSASSVDQIPKQLAGALMFGTGTTVPVPDVDRTQHLLMLGANPLASNGSLMTAPDM